jgi:hypothetical protein
MFLLLKKFATIALSFNFFLRNFLFPFSVLPSVSFFLTKKSFFHFFPSFQNAIDSMKNTYCLFQIKFITEYTNVQHIIITQI